MVDEGSKFRVARMIHQGQKKHVSAGQFLSQFREAWVAYFGIPHTLRLDPDGAFRSHEVADFCDNHHIYLDIIPGEAHWKLSSCERSIESIKYLLEKIVADHPDVSAPDALADSIRILNTKDNIRGHSPLQHVMGRTPDAAGRFFSTVDPACPELTCLEPRAMQHENWERMVTAEKALIDWQCQQRVSRATNSRHRQVRDFSAGDLVYIWRKQLTGQDAGQNKQGSGRFVGPARILATEMKRDQQGELQRGSSIWLVRGRRLIKCCAEQLRHATDKEHIIHELHQPDTQPWTFPKVAEELGGTEFDDYTEVSSAMEWERANDPEEEWQPAYRFRQKRTPTAADLRAAQDPRPPPARVSQEPPAPGELPTISQRRDRSRSPTSTRRPEPAVGFVEAPHWSEQVHESFFMDDMTATQGFWKQEDAAHRSSYRISR
eukprot:s548_g35.t1